MKNVVIRERPVVGKQSVLPGVFMLVFLVFTACTGLASSPDPIFVVGGEKVNADKVTLPYAFLNSPGATLALTPTGGYTILLARAVIGTGGIQGLVPYTVELFGENVITIAGMAGEDAYLNGQHRADGIFAGRGLRITGPGSLTILNMAPEKCGPNGIRTGQYGYYGGNLLVTDGASLSVKTYYGDAIAVDNGWTLAVDSSVVSTYSGIGWGFRSVTDVDVGGGKTGKVVFSDSIVVDSSYGGAFAGADLEIAGSYCTFIDEYKCLGANANLTIGNSVVNAYSAKGNAISGSGNATGEDRVLLGRGLYRLATGTESCYAIGSYRIVVDGANIECCTPNGMGISFGNDCVIKSGLLKMRSDMDVRSEFAFASLVVMADGTLSSWDSIANGEAFYAAAMSGAWELARSFFVRDPAGNPYYGIYAKDSAYGRLAVSGGTVDAHLATRGGYCVKSAAVSGGSLSGNFILQSSAYQRTHIPTELLPNCGGVALECVTEKIAGVGEGDLIEAGWRTPLPSYYGTYSLYADRTGSLHFWLPKGSDWSPSYLINYELNGGTNGAGNPGSYKVDKLPVALVGPNRAGYVFAGWQMNGRTVTQIDRGTVGDITLVANWVEGDYAVWFIDGGGSIQMKGYFLGCVYNLPMYTLIPPAGKRFAGWACSNGRRYDDGMLVFNLAEPGEIVTMTAIWE